MDRLNPEQRKKNMQAIKSRDTKAEIQLRKSLWALGYRYRKNSGAVFGKPDIVFLRRKIAVFVDSEFFHGRNWELNKYRIKSRRDFWWTKIEGNIARDRKVEEVLCEKGWQIIRLWDTEIVKNLANCISKIEKVYYGKEVFRSSSSVENGCEIQK